MGNDPGYTETITTGELTAGANGLFTIRLETGTYTLTETLPTGYYGPGTVQVTVTKPADGPITYYSVAQNLPTDVPTPADGWLKYADTDHITILNVPRMLISVTARSSWPENGEKLPVTVQLWCDGTPVPGTNTRRCCPRRTIGNTHGTICPFSPTAPWPGTPCG